MAQSLKHGLALRRTTLATLLCVVGVFAAATQEHWGANRPRWDYLTGWVLCGLILFLTTYNLRKKLLVIPLLKSRTWFQAHVYLGLLSGLTFLLHLQWHWPTGAFEVLLALVFALTASSGLVGWWLSRTLARRLTAMGGEVPYERIPLIRRALREAAEHLVLGVIPATRNTTLAEFYAGRLAPFFALPANFASHIFHSRRPLNGLLAQIADLKRFLNEDERTSADTLASLVRQKDALDFHCALQLTLKGWLFVHIPLTYALLVFIGAHVLLVYGFSGGAR